MRLSSSAGMWTLIVYTPPTSKGYCKDQVKHVKQYSHVKWFWLTACKLIHVGASFVVSLDFFAYSQAYFLLLSMQRLGMPFYISFIMFFLGAVFGCFYFSMYLDFDCSKGHLPLHTGRAKPFLILQSLGCDPKPICITFLLL